jgi:hypothetical protein
MVCHISPVLLDHVMVCMIVLFRSNQESVPSMSGVTTRRTTRSTAAAKAASGIISPPAALPVARRPRTAAAPKKAAAKKATPTKDDNKSEDDNENDKEEEVVVEKKEKKTTPKTAKPSGIPVRNTAAASKKVVEPVAATVEKKETSKSVTNGAAATVKATPTKAAAKKQTPTAAAVAVVPPKVETKAPIAPGSDDDNDSDNDTKSTTSVNDVAEVGTSSDFPADASGSSDDDEEEADEGDDEANDSLDDDSDDDAKKPAPVAAKKKLFAASTSSTNSNDTSLTTPAKPSVGSITDESSATSHRGFYLTELDLGPEVEQRRVEGETPEQRATRRANNARLRRAHGKKFLPADQRTGDDANLAELSDSSEEEGGMMNRIGGVPLEWYDNYDHIGYDVHGKRIARPAGGDTLDRLLARADDPNFGYVTTHNCLQYTSAIFL